VLIVLAETVALTNAVTFWSQYDKFSERYSRGRGGKFGGDEEDTVSSFARAQRRAQATPDCAAASSSGDGECEASGVLSSPRLFRLAKRIVSTAAAAPSYDASCCARCPSCLEIRGGHSHKKAAEAVIDAAASGAVSAASSAATPYNLPLNMWKVIFQAFLTALNVFCWLIPLRSKKISENKLALSLANAFSGGVFLSLAFGHLLPECVHGFTEYNEVLPYMLVLAGYLLIFFVEKVAFDAHGLMHGEEHAHHHHGECRTVSAKANGAAAGDDEEEGAHSGRSAVILLGALAVHSILEMTALGLANTFGDSALLSLSIALHQPAESIALLVAFLKSGMPKGQIMQYLSIFSCMGPIGVGIGMAVNEFAAPIVDAIMLAVVAGTFIYVGATEVIPEEWEDQEHKWKKFFALISGIVSIFLITQYTMSLEA